MTMDTHPDDPVPPCDSPVPKVRIGRESEPHGQEKMRGRQVLWPGPERRNPVVREEETNNTEVAYWVYSTAGRGGRWKQPGGLSPNREKHANLVVADYAVPTPRS